MDREKYFKCKKCNHLIRFLNWNVKREKGIPDLKCPYCGLLKSLKILRKRPYYRLKLQTYLSIDVHKDGNELVLSK